MYRVLLLDDEPLARRGLRSFAAWSNYGFEIAAEASSLKEARRLVCELDINLVVLDMELADGEGLQLLTESSVRGVQPMAAIVVSCHDRFDYATRALRTGVIDYLHKLSLDEETLGRSLTRVLRYLENHGAKARPKAPLSNFVARLENRVAGSHDEHGWDSLNVIGGILYEWGSPVANSMKEWLLSAVSSCLHRDTALEIDAAVLKETQLLVVVSGSERGESGVRLGGLIAETMVELHYGGICLPAVTLLPMAVSPGDLVEAVGRVTRCEGGRFALGPGGVDLNFRTPVSHCCLLSKATVKQLQHLAATRMWAHLRQLIMGIMQRARAERTSGARTRALGAEVHWVVYEAGGGHEVLPRSDLAEQIASASTVTEIEMALLFLAVCLQQATMNMGTMVHPAVHRAQSYVRNALYEPISLDDVASAAGMSPSYLSTQFHKETGEHLSSFINRCKVEEAIRLIERTDMSVAEVAERLGFSDASYFSKVFKRYSNRRPGEFRSKKSTIPIER